jgi:S1/P1 Nuclease
LPRGQRKSWSNGDEVKWAWESHELANRVIYKRLHIPVEDDVFPESCKTAPDGIQSFKAAVDNTYIAEMQPLIREQLTKGGLRLAAALNKAFD